MRASEVRNGQGQRAMTDDDDPRRVRIQGSLDDVALWGMSVVKVRHIGGTDDLEFVAVGHDEMAIVTMDASILPRMPEDGAWRQAYALLAPAAIREAVVTGEGMDALRRCHGESWKEFLANLGISYVVTCEVAGDGSGRTATCETHRDLLTLADDDPLLLHAAHATYLSTPAWGRILAWVDPDDYEGDESVLLDAVDAVPCREGATDEERQLAYLRKLSGGCPWETEAASLVVPHVAPMGFPEIMSALADEVGRRFDYFNGMSERNPGHEPLNAALMARYGLTATMARGYLLHELEARMSQAGGRHLAFQALSGLSEDIAIRAIPGYAELLDQEKNGASVPRAGVCEEDMPF